MNLESRKSGLTRHWLMLLPAIIILALLSYRLLVVRRADAKGGKIDVSALHLQSLDGTPLPVSRYQGKAIVLNFWAPWCPPCRVEIPWLQKIQLENKDAIVIGVVADPSQYSKAQAFMDSQRVTYTLVQSSPSIEKLVGPIQGLPTTFYVSAKGNIVHTVTGLVSSGTMSSYVKDALRN